MIVAFIGNFATEAGLQRTQTVEAIEETTREFSATLMSQDGQLSHETEEPFV